MSDKLFVCSVLQGFPSPNEPVPRISESTSLPAFLRYLVFFPTPVKITFLSPVCLVSILN
jgi:hypothetical protein